ncbi:hypothetical protein [Bizionia sp.]|uniref:hypothetical protein n=1 Tax=Bizionia sp. TaxID=1954480 RepID=UPI003A94D51C
MITKISHSSFEIDLTSYKLSMVEENHWFSDRYLAKYTVPINITLSDDLNAKLGDIMSYNSKSKVTFLDVKFFHNGEIHEAVMEAEELKKREATINVRYGLEEVPNYDKPLKELPLEEVELSGETIFEHATTKIAQTYPTTNYNFVQVHCNQFDTESDQWKHFEGIINKRVGSSWVENEYDAVEDEQVNRNIMQPQPYLMHVLTSGFLDAGYTLAGNFTQDPQFKKALLSEISTYYSTITVESQELTLTQDEYSSIVIQDNEQYGEYSKTLTLSEYGRYKIAGNLTINKVYGFAFIRVKFNGSEYYWFPVDFSERGNFSRQIEFNIDFFFGSGVIEIQALTLADYVYEGIRYNTQTIADLSITQLSKFDVSGNLLPTLILPTDIKLTECVPDITFGDLLTTLKNWFNLDLDIIGSEVILNFITTQLPVVDAYDLSEFEIEDPRRVFSKGDTYLLKFQDVSSEEYTFDSVFVKENEVLINNYVANDDTNEIVINGLPLPIATKKNITTADHFLDDKSRLKLIVYDGTAATLNVAEPVDDLLVPAVYALHFDKWLKLRLNAQMFTWSFVMTDEQLRNIKSRNKVFAYKNNHILKTINKDLVARGIWNVELETLTIE